MSIRLSGIFVYPVKAVRGVAVNQALAEPAGLAQDRRWVVVGADGQFISQRTHPVLATVTARAEPGGLEMAAPGLDDLKVREPQQGPRQTVQIWRSSVSGAAAGPIADAWLTRLLGERCHLIWMDRACRRALDHPGAGPEAVVSFADGYPLLAAGEASLADLNARLATPVPMDRFRPNLVFTGGDPYAEDGWSSLVIGEAQFLNAGPCARCQVTTVDQATGRSAGSEPLRTLAGYRQSTKGVLFGVNLLVARPGLIKLGDKIHLAETPT